MKHENSQILILGWAEDVALVAEKLPYSTGRAHENSDHKLIPTDLEMVVYIFSRDTGYSSQLLSLFSYVHAGIVPRNEFVLSLGKVDLKSQVFPVISGVPEISLDTLCSLRV